MFKLAQDKIWNKSYGCFGHFLRICRSWRSSQNFQKLPDGLSRTLKKLLGIFRSFWKFLRMISQSFFWRSSSRFLSKFQINLNSFELKITTAPNNSQKLPSSSWEPLGTFCQLPWTGWIISFSLLIENNSYAMLSAGTINYQRPLCFCAPSRWFRIIVK